ncbi:MAG: formate dehydrogenase accessory sulfurtransferase FdhD [Oscillospiraceae bacterium]|nr:formate dehydrogenase accessory sulfurtransferase FdhD [Oscillospiraceae bacterium]
MRVIVPKELEMATEQHMATHFSSRGQSFRYPDDLVAEHTMEIYLNDTPAYEVVCSPTDLPELVLGRLLSNGVIQSTDEVELLYLCENGLRAKVYLPKWEPATEHPGVEQVSTCCTGNRTIADLFRNQTPPRHLRPIAYEQRWIFRLAEAMKEDMPLYAATHGTHSCLLMHKGEILRRAEDIGRHNALDKVLGWALMQGIPLEECIVYTSGRIPVDMVMKVIRAGVPVLASKAMPTRESVLLAEEFGLSLIGAARKDSMVVF